jgi:hypothetical protein
MAHHCGHFTMDIYLWTFTCGYFTLLHVILFVHFALFHVVSFDQSLDCLSLAVSLDSPTCAHSCRRSPSQHVSRRRSPSLHASDTHCDCPLDTSTRLHLAMPDRCFAHTLVTLLFILRTYVGTRPIQTVALYVCRQSIPGVYPFHCNDRRVETL